MSQNVICIGMKVQIRNTAENIVASDRNMRMKKMSIAIQSDVRIGFTLKMNFGRIENETTKKKAMKIEESRSHSCIMNVIIDLTIPLGISVKEVRSIDHMIEHRMMIQENAIPNITEEVREFTPTSGKIIQTEKGREKEVLTMTFTDAIRPH